MIRYVITGRPGIGKSTLFNNIVDRLLKYNIVVGGIRTPEVRDRSGSRVGFKVVDLISGEERWLARVDCASRVRVGKYGVLVEEAGELIVSALERAIRESSVVGIDEVGPMELKVGAFREYLLKILEMDKPLILVVHYRLEDPLILNKLARAEKYELTLYNRDQLNRTLPQKVLAEVVSSLRGARSA